MEFFAISGLLNGLAALGLALLIYFRSPQDPRYWTYALFWATIAVWSFGYFFWLSSTTPAAALFFSKLLMAGAIFIAVAFFHHVVSLLGKLDRFQKFLKINYLIGIGFGLAVWTPYFITGVHPILNFPFWPKPGWLFHFFLVWWGFVVIFAHWQLFQGYSKEKGVHRQQYSYLLIASGIGFLGGATNFPLWYGIEIPPFGNILVTVYVALVGFTFLRYHLMGFSVFVEKRIAYFSLLLLVSQPVYPVLLLAQKSIFGAINVKYSVLQLAAHLLTVAGAYQMRVGTRGAVARTVLKGREYRFNTLNQLTSKVSEVQEVSDIGQVILETLGKGIGATKAAILVLKPEESRYQVVSTFGFSPEHPLLQKGWGFSEDLPQLLLYTRSSISVDDLKKAKFDEWEKKVASQLEAIGLSLCHPVFSNNQLVGILALGSFSRDGLRLLGGNIFWNTIIHEATLALENAILRKEIQRSQRKMHQIDRLRSLEVMAKGLTQELHNPLVSMKAFVQLAQLRRHDRNFMDSLHRVVGDDLAKIEELTKEIRAYVKPLSESLNSKINVHETLDSCLLFFLENPIYHHMKFDKQFSQSVPLIHIDRQGLMQVIFNGLLFLLKDASLPGRTLQIETKKTSLAMGQCWVQIELLWKFSDGSPKEQLATVENTEFEDPFFALNESREKRGLVLACEIIQGYGGSFKLLTKQSSILGIQIQLPVFSSHDHENFQVIMPGAALSEARSVN